MTDPGPGETAQLTFWRTVAIVLMGIVSTLCLCVYNTNRTAVTKEDLIPIQTTVSDTQGKVNQMSLDLSYLQGQLKAKRILER